MFIDAFSSFWHQLKIYKIQIGNFGNIRMPTIKPIKQYSISENYCISLKSSADSQHHS